MFTTVVHNFCSQLLFTIFFFTNFVYDSCSTNFFTTIVYRLCLKRLCTSFLHKFSPQIRFHDLALKTFTSLTKSFVDSFRYQPFFPAEKNLYFLKMGKHLCFTVSLYSKKALSTKHSFIDCSAL